MTTDQTPAGQVAKAVLAVPGVAFLRPGLADLLRTPAAARLSRGPAAPPGLRVTRRAEEWSVEIKLVLRRGHRALDVTRAVRAAAESALRDRTGRSTPVQVTVTVTGLV